MPGDALQLEELLKGQAKARQLATLKQNAADDAVVPNLAPRDQEPVYDFPQNFAEGEETESWTGLLLGRRYNRVKKAPHDGGKGSSRSASGDQFDPQSNAPEKTADRLAVEHGVSSASAVTVTIYGSPGRTPKV